MKKKTAKRLSVVLALSYLTIISGGVVLWKVNQKESKIQPTLSEAEASDNVGYGKDFQSENKQDGSSNEQSNSDISTIIDSENQESGSQESTSSEIEVTPMINDQTQEETNDLLKKDGSVRMVFTGDVYIGNYVSTVYDAGGLNSVLSPQLQDLFQTADLAMVNQEFPFSTRGVPMEDKQYTFRVDPLKARLLQEMSVDIVSLANNHTLDYGVEALEDTVDILNDADITYVGAGKNLEEAKTTRYFDLNGKRIAVLSASRVIPVSEWQATSFKPGLFTTYDPTALLQEIQTAKQQADFIIVYVHWGIEHKEYPENYQRVMGKQFIDAGANLVIGSHPHVLQGFEYYNDGLIAYSLGNFIFSQTIAKTAMLSVELGESDEFQVTVYPCQTINGKTQELTQDSQIQSIYSYLSSISENAQLTEQGQIVEK